MFKLSIFILSNFALSIFFVTPLLSQETYGIEYWRIRFDIRSEDYIAYNFDIDKKINFFPSQSLMGIYEKYLFNLDSSILKRKQTLEILEYGWQNYKGKNQTSKEKALQYQHLTYLHFLGGNTYQAVLDNQNAIDYLIKSINERLKIDPKDSTGEVKYEIFEKNTLILMNIAMKKVLERQSGEKLNYDDSILENRSWLHENPINMFLFLQTLVIVNNTQQMEAILNSEFKKSGKSTLFVSKEISNLIFKIITENMGYWISTEMKNVIEKYRMKFNSQLPSCEFVDLLEKKCV